MQKKYLIFDLDGTLIESVSESEKVVLSVLSEIPQINLDEARYLFENTKGTPLVKQLEQLCEWLDIDTFAVSRKIYEEIYKLDCVFFPGVPEKIRELSKKYALFLTTENSTPTALKYLNMWWIYDCFSVILGSDDILKWTDHLECFQTFTEDTEFYMNAVYIWDGNSDRTFAHEKNIDFIHIGMWWEDQYELSSVSLMDIMNLIKE